MRHTGKWCVFHRSWGHRTKNCDQLRIEIERLLKIGYLRQFIERGEVSPRREQPRERREEGRPREQSEERRKDGVRPEREDSQSRRRRYEDRSAPEKQPQHQHLPPPPPNYAHNPLTGRMVNMIEGEPLSISSTQRKRKFVKETQRVSLKYHVFSTTISAPPAITFGPTDLIDIVHPHDDPIVIQATIHGAEVARVLIDTGSSVDVMFLPTFLALGLKMEQIVPEATPLVGFDGNSSETLSSIPLLMSWGGGHLRRTEEVKFWVVNALAKTYNVICGRPSLCLFEAVPSVLHLKVKFPTLNGIGEVRGNQTRARECRLNTVAAIEEGENVNENLQEPRRTNTGKLYPAEKLKMVEVIPGEAEEAIIEGNKEKIKTESAKE